MATVLIDSKTPVDIAYLSDKSNMLRWRKTINKMNPDIDVDTVLDIGDVSTISIMIGKLYKCKVENTTGELDEIRIGGQYQVITMFEVLEHLLNPLHVLIQINESLLDRGRLYITTPCPKPYFLWGKRHFHEMTWSRLKYLIDKAGFEVIKKSKVRAHPYWFHLTGIRPLLKFFYNKHWFLELRPK